MNKPEIEKDLVIIGAGTAGLTAGIYASRLKLSTLILEDEIVGGQINDAYEVENYPGFMKVKGSDLTDIMKEQAIYAGAEIDEFDSIKKVNLADEFKIIETDSYRYKAKSVIVAAGAKKRPLPIPEEKKYLSKGIHYCELCDGHMYEGKHIVVVGGGNSAIGAALVLLKYASKLTIIHQFDSFNADKKTVDKFLANEKVEVIWNTEVRHGFGDKNLEKIEIENLLTKDKSMIDVDAMFVYIGHTPRTDMYKEFLEVDNYGNLLANEDCETKIKGVYAAGDVRAKKFRQLTTATSDGTIAALMAEEYIKNLN